MREEVRMEKIAQLLDQLSNDRLSRTERARLERELDMLGSVLPEQYAIKLYPQPLPDFEAIYRRRAELDQELFGRSET